MEKEQNHTDGIQEQEPNPEPEKLIAITTDNIGALIAEELKKVVGLDETVLAEYTTFLENMPIGEIETLLGTLKKDLDEKLLPFLELMTQQGSSKVAEAGILSLGKI